MRVARYVGDGEVAILEQDPPTCPPGGLLVQTEACGLCSGELMSWYMDRKVPHVLGHEVAGRVVESDNAGFPVGARIFPHHHAPCLKCRFCRMGRFVHCEQWRRTKLDPGGMADTFAVGEANLTDTFRVDDLRPEDAALIEPMACVMKSLRLAESDAPGQSVVIGLGTMGLMHLLLLPEGSLGYDVNLQRARFARALDLNAGPPDEAVAAETVFVCPGSQAAFEFALRIVRPGGTIAMFAPLPPEQALTVPQEAYFKDVRIVNSYSCGPTDTAQATTALRNGRIKAEQVCSEFIELEQLPERYKLMKAGAILKPMVVWN
jgi:L-iditol 2-dehydrogenase